MSILSRTSSTTELRLSKTIQTDVTRTLMHLKKVAIILMPGVVGIVYLLLLSVPTAPALVTERVVRDGVLFLLFLVIVVLVLERIDAE